MGVYMLLLDDKVGLKVIVFVTIFTTLGIFTLIFNSLTATGLHESLIQASNTHSPRAEHFQRIKGSTFRELSGFNV